jgi:hypothetical protein
VLNLLPPDIRRHFYSPRGDIQDTQPRPEERPADRAAARPHALKRLPIRYGAGQTSTPVCFSWPAPRSGSATWPESETTSHVR